MARTVRDRADVIQALAGVFRRRGFDAGSLSVIQKETGVGRGSLYHFFPNGKEDMARAVLSQVGGWFDDRIFGPLREDTNAAQAVTTMSREVGDYFVSNQRVCLFAVMTLGEEQDAFAAEVRSYFTDWVDALAATLTRGGLTKKDATQRALDAVATIQGGLILSRATGDEDTFLGINGRVERSLLACLSDAAR
ncbi:MAG: TetR/AcrR family transcriptional regulator [Mycetocola sp.]